METNLDAFIRQTIGYMGAGINSTAGLVEHYSTGLARGRFNTDKIVATLETTIAALDRPISERNIPALKQDLFWLETMAHAGEINKLARTLKAKLYK